MTVLMNDVTATAIAGIAPVVSVGDIAVRGKQEPMPVYTLR